MRKLVTCAMEAGPHVTARVRHQGDRGLYRHRRPAAPGNHPGGGRVGRPGPLGVGDHHPRPGRAGPRLRHHPRLLLGQSGRRAGPRRAPGVLPDDYRSLERYGFDLAGFHAHAGRSSMTPLIPALAGALIVAGLHRSRRRPAPHARHRRRGRPAVRAYAAGRSAGGPGSCCWPGCWRAVSVALLTGWLVAVLVVPAAAAGLPVLLAAPPRTRPGPVGGDGGMDPLAGRGA